MNAFRDHTLADDRHAARDPVRAAQPERAPRRRRDAPVVSARRRVGALLVEAGLHLMTGGEPAGQISSPLAR
jgi:hypothetical protein